MATGARWTLMLVRLCGLVLLVTGVLFWTGRGLAGVSGHMGLGVVLVLSLWLLAFLGARAGAPLGLVAAAAVWGAVVLWFGMVQRQLVPGDAHWMIQVVHLLLGLGAIGLAEALAARIARRVNP